MKFQPSQPTKVYTTRRRARYGASAGGGGVKAALPPPPPLQGPVGRHARVASSILSLKFGAHWTKFRMVLKWLII